MKTLVKGLLFGDVISNSTILRSEGVRQLLWQRRERVSLRLAQHTGTLSLILQVEEEGVQGEVRNKNIVEKTETEGATRRGPVLHGGEKAEQ